MRDSQALHICSSLQSSDVAVAAWLAYSNYGFSILAREMALLGSAHPSMNSRALDLNRLPTQTALALLIRACIILIFSFTSCILQSDIEVKH